MPEPDPEPPIFRPENEGGFEDLLKRALAPPSMDLDGDIYPLVPAPVQPPVKEGDLIAGRYRVGKLIAKGGVGFVLRAVDVQSGRAAAVKLLLPQYAKEPKVRARFDLEAKVAAKIGSEHVPGVLATGEIESGAQFIVMEYLEGEDLTRALERGKMPPREAVDLVLQACEAVGKAHAAGIVHRDLKPANLFVARLADGSACVKVIDFGLAKELAQARSAQRSEPSITKSTVIGTPRYMAPEQVLSSREADARADIWALGTILFELMTGVSPFGAKSIPVVFARILHQPPPGLRTFAPDAPAELEAVVLRCLQKDVSARYQTVEELASALSKIRWNKGGKAPRGGGASVVSRVVWSVVAAAVGVAVAGAGVFLLGKRGPTAEAKMGVACAQNGECGPLQCIEGICSRPCSGPADCPARARCTKAGTCAVPLKVGFVYVGVPEDEGWTRTHDRGRRGAMAKLPYLETDFVANAHDPEVAERAIDGFAAKGFDVVVANSFSLREPVAKKAKQYPGVKFLVYSYPPSPQVGAFGGRLEQAWYLAGYAAARKSRSRRLGFVGSLVTPEVVRHVNAFVRGARRWLPTVDVEVRWLGFWFDTEKADAKGRHKEERLVDELLATGCDVIAHNADNGRVVQAVEASGKEALSIGNDNPDACDQGPRTCLGAVAWNWEPVYTAIFEDVHRGAWTPAKQYHEGIKANREQSTVSFVLSPKAGGPELALDTATVLAELANDPAGNKVFEGPYCSTGQRESCLGRGESPSEDELRSMCWFVAGAVEKANPADPRSADRPARVPEACATQR